MSKSARKTLLGVLMFVLLGLQTFQPSEPRAVLPGDGSITDHVSIPSRVDVLLRTACFDCHSAETRWPWYSRISPLSWLVGHDVQHGRSNLDFSNWSMDPDREPTPVQRLRWMCRDVREGVMPPRLYRLVHPQARLSGDDMDLVCSWTEQVLSQMFRSPP